MQVLPHLDQSCVLPIPHAFPQKNPDSAFGVWGPSLRSRTYKEALIPTITSGHDHLFDMAGYGQGYYRLPHHPEDAQNAQQAQGGPVASSSRQYANGEYPEQSNQLAQYHQQHVPEASVQRPEPLPDQAERKTPRPPNAWILYRSQKFRELQQTKDPQARSSNTGKTKSQAEISRIISQMWQSESAAVRRSYEALADEKKLEHQRMYPTYRYRPKKRAKENRKTEASVRGQQQSDEGSHRQRNSSSPYQASARVSPHRRHVQPSVYSGFEGNQLREGLFKSMPTDHALDGHVSSSSMQAMMDMDRRRQERVNHPAGQWVGHGLPQPLSMTQQGETTSSMQLGPAQSGSYRSRSHPYQPSPNRSDPNYPRQAWEMGGGRGGWQATASADQHPEMQSSASKLLTRPSEQHYFDHLTSAATPSHGGSQPDLQGYAPVDNQHFYANTAQEDNSRRPFNYFA